MDDRYPFLRNLPSYKFYEKLNEEYDEDSYREDIYYEDCKRILPQYPDSGSILNLCGKLVRNIRKLYAWTNNDIHKSERCTYLNYWIYNEVINNHGISENYIYNSNFILYLFYVWDTIDEKLSHTDKCAQEKYLIRSNEFLEEKKSYDDNQNYKSIKDIVNSGKNDQNNDYFSYITENENLHRVLKEECKCTNNTKFCVEFHKYNRDNKKDKLCSLECNSEMSSVPNTELNSVCPLPESVLQSLPEQMSQEKESETGTFTGSMEVKDDISSSSTSSSTITISLLTSIIGIFPLLYISYKFTPFGPWLRRRISNKKIISGYTDNESNQNLQYIPDTMMVTSKNGSYAIPHHSLINF
ncbi:PIR Superfamily Protein [Plasmodium ovale wallikeri]|uniref:PIR Superfamily Protein n=1 Tax=Plasmodium ovale wallikeri TaxID=864142 RepID=A0A1A9AR50_PLAOA|nr:PIR Superfamily Protein [Plasmodium ovale wallikeri]